MRSLTRACLCRWDLLVYRVDIGSCISSLLSSSCLRSVPGELRRLRRCSWLTGPSPSSCRRRDINLHVFSGCLRNVVIAWPHLVRSPCLGYLVLPGWALTAPCFVFAAAGGTFPSHDLSSPRWAVAGVVLLRTVATCCCCLALGSYVAVSLALEALLHSALSLISLALEDLALPDQTFVDDLVGILRFGELDGDGRCCLSSCVSGEPAYVSYLRLGYERSVVLQYLRSDLVQLAHVHRARAYAVSEDAERRDLHCSPTADAVGPVVRELS